ncbi:BMP-binding endothelial regulator protein isoform X1 [Homalodisca vitripennis]|nr:BMP-binding endothelial regulator protein isoform X1 [Homalodisca vitripennis]XP_046680029.1 BMP-binding endothelial regulator protein isoform X1 [Homalodisca vitripennis]
MSLTTSLILLLCGLQVMPDAESLIVGVGVTGKTESCVNEGEVVNTDNISKSRCFTCTCKNGYVECAKERCLSAEGCFMLLDHSNDGCCYQCKGCMHEGVYRESGTQWRDPQRPCRILSCKAGVVTETEEVCYTPCALSRPPREGQCCRTCKGCEINGQIVTESRNVTSTEDPCIKCHCKDGHMTCTKKACPVLNCPDTAVEHNKGECCPQCKGSRRLIEPPKGSCLLKLGLHQSGKTFQHDDCTKCTCSNGTLHCQRKSCPPLDCPEEMQVRVPGICCPYCPRKPLPAKGELYTACRVGGRTYQDGETWQLDQCKSCACSGGLIRCAMPECPQLGPCPPRFKLHREPGQCCPTCVEEDGVCTVFGDPHYKTFDGKFFSFQGSCKYQLVADCREKTFNIRVTNDARSTKTSSWTKTVSLKIGGIKVNLGERQRLKVNGVKVAVPYRMPTGQVTVRREDETLRVDTYLGVKVLWDGKSFLEVSVPAKYKGKLCGLCGNFNSMSRDDLMTRRGRVVLDPDKFGASWRVGGKRACMRTNEPPTRAIQCSQHLPQRRYRDRLCKPLRTEVFAACHKKLNYAMYFKSCLLDMCECPGRKCYCESFTAYAHECQRLGVALPTWRDDTGCHAFY